MNYNGTHYPSIEDNFLGHHFKILTNEKYKTLFKKVFLTITNEDYIELPLQIFSCLSYLFSDDKNLERYIEEKFDNVNHYLISINNQFLKAKVCNFYSYNLDSFFHDTENILTKSFDDSTNFLFSCLLAEDQNINLNYTALESIDPLIFEKDIRNVVKDFVVVYAKNIFDLLHNQKFKFLTETLKFREFINNLIEYYIDAISYCAESIFNYCWSSLLNDINEYFLEKAKLINMNYINNTDNFINEKDLINREFQKNTEIKPIKFNPGNFHTLQIIIQKIKDIPSKSLIYNKIFYLMFHLKDLLDFYHEEDVLELIKLAIIDIRLIPNEFINCLANFLLSIEPKLNSISTNEINLETYDFNNECFIEKDKYTTFIKNYKEGNKIQTYHIHFIFSFLKNVKYEDVAVNYYKNRLLALILFKLKKDIYIHNKFFPETKDIIDNPSLDKLHELEKNNKLNIGIYLKMLYCYIIVVFKLNHFL